MPAPTTTQKYLDLVRKSELVEAPRLESYLRGKSLPASATPALLAAALVRAGLLTQFQGQQLLLGKWRGFVLGKYRLLELLGSGGMGRVFLVEHLQLHRLAAIKIPPSGPEVEAAALERFYREGRAVAALDHPNIVRAYDIDHDGKLHFLVMEFVDGSSFFHLVNGRGPLEVTRACHYIAQAAAGLRHAHEAGWIHRDIKPSNILVDRQGAVKILDMGLARFFPEDRDGLTRKYDEGNILGSADYLAPEQAVDSSQSLDTRADLYSLGATIYFLLSGRPPFPEGNVTQKIIWHQLRAPGPIRDLRPEVPAELAVVPKRMMAKDRGKRFQTPGDVVEALRPWTTEPLAPLEEEMPRYCPLVWNLIQTNSPRSPGPGADTRRTTPPSAATSNSSRAKTPTSTPDRPPAKPQHKKAKPPSRIPSPSSPSFGHWWFVAAGGAGLLLLLLVVGWVLLQALPQSPPAPLPVSDNQKTPKPFPADPGIVPAAEAILQVGKRCTVQLKVRNTGWSQNGQTFFLNSEIDRNHPANFTALSHQIDKFAAANIADPAAFYTGKTIRVTGLVKLFRERPEILVTDPGQIEVIEEKKN